MDAPLGMGETVVVTMRYLVQAGLSVLSNAEGCADKAGEEEDISFDGAHNVLRKIEQSVTTPAHFYNEASKEQQRPQGTTACAEIGGYQSLTRLARRKGENAGARQVSKKPSFASVQAWMITGLRVEGHQGREKVFGLRLRDWEPTP